MDGSLGISSVWKALLALWKKLQRNEKYDIECGLMAQRYVINVIFLALTGVWAALMLASALIPTYPIFGTPVMITLSSVLLAGLTSALLGPLWGTLSGFIFGWLVPYINPSTSMGLLTFLGPTMAALMSGLVLFDRWKEATLIFAAQMFIWFANPFAWYELMPIITWQYVPVLIFIIVPPIRKWIIKSIVTRNPASLSIALWCLAWIARIGGDVATSNNNAVWVLGWGVPEMYPYWAPMTLYYAITDSLNCFAAAIVGTAVLLALKRANIKMLAIDFLESKMKQQK
jgi:hypothetical protein